MTYYKRFKLTRKEAVSKVWFLYLFANLHKHLLNVSHYLVVYPLLSKLILHHISN
jgi:hypothetical protein